MNARSWTTPVKSSSSFWSSEIAGSSSLSSDLERTSSLSSLLLLLLWFESLPSSGLRFLFERSSELVLLSLWLSFSPSERERFSKCCGCSPFLWTASSPERDIFATSWTVKKPPFPSNFPISISWVWNLGSRSTEAPRFKSQSLVRSPTISCARSRR